jgi:hypothetical protein
MNHKPASTFLLDQILAELDENHLATLYDEPIQKCCLTFLQTSPEPTDFTTFNQSLTSFTMLVFKEALRLKMNLTQEQAFGKAKRLLDHHYPGGGYERAYLDATLPNGPGFAAVLKTLAEGLITEQHAHHITWTHTKYTTDWNTRLSLVQEILQHHPLLPLELHTQPTWVLTEQIPELIQAMATTQSVLGGLVRQ